MREVAGLRVGHRHTYTSRSSHPSHLDILFLCFLCIGGKDLTSCQVQPCVHRLCDLWRCLQGPHSDLLHCSCVRWCPAFYMRC